MQADSLLLSQQEEKLCQAKKKKKEKKRCSYSSSGAQDRQGFSLYHPHPSPTLGSFWSLGVAVGEFFTTSQYSKDQQNVENKKGL